MGETEATKQACFFPHHSATGNAKTPSCHMENEKRCNYAQATIFHIANGTPSTR